MTSEIWLPLKKAAQQLGMGKESLRGKGYRGTHRRKMGPDGKYLYLVETSKGSNPMQYRERYIYDPTKKIYIMNLKGQKRPQTFPEAFIKDVWSHYVTHKDSKATCKKFGFTKSSFDAIRRALGLTQKSGPFTPEKMAASTVEELVQDLEVLEEAKKERQVAKAYEARIQEDAEKFRHVKRHILQSVEEINWKKWKAPKTVQRKESKSNVIGFLGTSDFHVGKRTFGEEGSLEEQFEFLQGVSFRTIKRTIQANGGAPSKWVLMIGSDLLHSDNIAQTTTRGTPQGPQSVGSTYSQVATAIRLMGSIVDEARKTAPVEALWIPGNHDELASFAVAAALNERYAHCEDVCIDLNESSRKVYAFGKVPVMFTHGHDIREGDYLPTMAREIPAGCDLDLALIIQGHLHQYSRKNARKTKGTEREDMGVQVITLSAPCKTDDWHKRRGYDKARVQMTSLLINESLGLEGIQLVR